MDTRRSMRTTRLLAGVGHSSPPARSGSARALAHYRRSTIGPLLRRFHVQLAPRILELGGLRREPGFDLLARRELANLFGELHRAEFRPAHRAEVRELGAVGGQRLVMELLRGVGIERQMELISPSKFEPRLGQRVVAELSAGMALREIFCVRCDLVRDPASL